ncbi:hypothetical protein GDO81_015248 [Engystomops pustulosus]|uniref:Uncharacterized protein n=1 Tax=Engystomops pustulosus TaxID=76066 RepID=A0AAV7AI99_ENGPU|nr:hypothetical protein GDO81_015248 [Engystomops pustulosus]
MMYHVRAHEGVDGSMRRHQGALTDDVPCQGVDGSMRRHQGALTDDVPCQGA